MGGFISLWGCCCDFENFEHQHFWQPYWGEQKVGFADREIWMTQPEPNQPRLQARLKNQRSVPHQLYDLVLTSAKSQEELEIYWETLT
jgi:hypothetical protein